MNTKQVLDEIWEERQRQDEKFGVQHRETEMRTDRLYRILRAHDPLTVARAEYEFEVKQNRVSWMTVLAEEFLEAIIETTPPVDRKALRAELIQVAAVAVAWIEDLDRTEVASE